MHLQDKRRAVDAGDWRDVADEIEIESFVECRVNGARRIDEKERVPVRGRTYDRLGGDIASRARTIVDDEWLAEARRQPLTDEARRNVGWAAGRTADDDAYGPRWISLRPRDARKGRERGRARGEI